MLVVVTAPHQIYFAKSALATAGVRPEWLVCGWRYPSDAFTAVFEALGEGQSRRNVMCWRQGRMYHHGGGGFGRKAGRLVFLARCVVAAWRMGRSHRDGIAIANPMSRLSKLLLLVLRSKRVLVFDDGTSTLELFDATDALARLKSPLLVSIFTPPTGTKLPYQRCRPVEVAIPWHNSFAGCRVFIGQPLVEDGLMDSEAYRALLQAFSGQGRTFYILHKRERLIKGHKGGNLEFVELPLPVECYGGAFKEAIAINGVCSTALVTLKLLLGEKVAISYSYVRLGQRNGRSAWFERCFQQFDLSGIGRFQ